MPKFLERKLKAQYGKDSKIPYKIMNSIGAMKGSKETAKGKSMQSKHEKKYKSEPGKKDSKKLLARVKPGKGNKQIAQGRAYEA